MEIKTNRRGNFRYDLETPIKYSNYGSDNHIEATMKNCSSGGLYFTSDLPVGPGTYISIMMVENTLDAAWPPYCKGCCAEVIWCNPMEDDDSRCYSIGAQYYE